MTTADIVEQALKLKAEERIRVVETLLESLDRPDPEIDRPWADEADRRLAAYRRGDTQGIPAEDLFPDA